MVDPNNRRDFGIEDVVVVYKILPAWVQWRAKEQVWKDVKMSFLYAAGEDAVAELEFPEVPEDVRRAWIH